MSHDHLSALNATGLLDTPSEAVFDRLTALVVRVLRVPVATIALIDEDRQFFKSSCGLPETLAKERETPLSHSFCKHVVYLNDPLIVEDSLTHPLVKDNLAVTGLGVMAYAGMPVRDANGVPVGALSAISDKQRSWSDDELATLKLLADQASSEIALRATARRLGHDVARMQSAEEHRHQMARLDRHDLRTPLNAMLLSISAVGYSGPVNADQKECIAAARRNGEAVLNIVDRMLDIGNIDHQGKGALDMRDCLPSDLIAQALEQVTALAARHRLQLEIDEAIVFPPVHVDRDKMVRVLVNLLGNAVKFTKEGGHISVSAKLGEQGTQVVFSVQDDGVGITPEDADRIFHEGVRLDPSLPTRRSTGLGLTFCKRVVEIHGGRIWVQSVLGQGSIFFFSIPACKGVAGA